MFYNVLNVLNGCKIIKIKIISLQKHVWSFCMGSLKPMVYTRYITICVSRLGYTWYTSVKKNIIKVYDRYIYVAGILQS